MLCISSIYSFKTTLTNFYLEFETGVKGRGRNTGWELYIFRECRVTSKAPPWNFNQVPLLDLDVHSVFTSFPLIGDSKVGAQAAGPLSPCIPQGRFRDELSRSDAPLEGSRGSSGSSFFANKWAAPAPASQVTPAHKPQTERWSALLNRIIRCVIAYLGTWSKKTQVI